MRIPLLNPILALQLTIAAAVAAISLQKPTNNPEFELLDQPMLNRSRYSSDSFSSSFPKQNLTRSSLLCRSEDEKHKINNQCGGREMLDN
jgi:hypothetical protein